MAVYGVLDRQPGEAEAVLVRDRLDARPRPDKDRCDKPHPRRVDCALQRTVVARMGDRRRRRRSRLAPCEQPLKFLVFSCHSCSPMFGSG